VLSAGVDKASARRHDGDNESMHLTGAPAEDDAGGSGQTDATAAD
jgi:hypothetical protein